MLANFINGLGTGVRAKIFRAKLLEGHGAWLFLNT